MLPCVSYAPFRRAGETPFDAGLHIAPQAIEADLRLLRAVTGCVRTYGLDHGLDAVPAVARRLGLRVVLGAWIGRDAAANEAQLRRALDLAHEYRESEDITSKEIPCELLTRKHRNGAVGKIDVNYLPQITRFEGTVKFSPDRKTWTS